MGSAHPVSQMTTCGTTTHSSRKTSIHSTSHCCLFILLKNYTIIFQHRKVLCKISPVYHLSRLCFKVSARYRTASSLVSNNLPRLAAEWLFETLSTLQELERWSTNIESWKDEQQILTLTHYPGMKKCLIGSLLSTQVFKKPPSSHQSAWQSWWWPRTWWTGAVLYFSVIWVSKYRWST